MDSRRLLQSIKRSRSAERIDELLVFNLLESLPKDLSEAVFAASIPHWVDNVRLAALLDKRQNSTRVIFERLKQLPFIEPYGTAGVSVHETTRFVLNKRNWILDQRHYKLFAKRLIDFFDKRGKKVANKILSLIRADKSLLEAAREFAIWRQKNPSAMEFSTDEIFQERFYLDLLLKPQATADRLAAAIKLTFDLSISFDYRPLLRMIREHETVGRVDGNISYVADFLDAYYLHEDGKPAKALVFYKKTLRDKNEFSLRPYAYLGVGDSHAELLNFKKAISAYKKSLKEFEHTNERNTLRVLNKLGDVHLQIGSLKKAMSCYARVLDVASESKLAHDFMHATIGMARSAFRLGKNGVSVNSLIEMVEKVQNNRFKVQLLDAVADAHELRGHFKAANKAYARALKIEPNNAYLMRNRARNYLLMGQRPSALRELKKVKKIDPDSPYTFIRSGDYYLESGQPAEAAVNYLRAQEIRPHFYFLYLSLANCYLKQGKFEACDAAISEALKHPQYEENIMETLQLVTHWMRRNRKNKARFVKIQSQIQYYVGAAQKKGEYLVIGGK